MIKKIKSSPEILIILLTIIPTLLLITILSNNPLLSIKAFFTGPFTSKYMFGNMLNRSAPLLLTSLGAFIALKSNNFNLGGEGQVYLGATTTGILLNTISDNPSPLILIVVVIIAVSASGLLTLISAILEIKYKVNVLISTYLLSMASIHICNYFVTGPFLMQGSNILTTEIINENYMLKEILKPSSLSTGFIIVVIIVLFTAFILNNSLWGYEFKISGRNKVFSASMGIDNRKYEITGLTLSGALHGLAGVILVIGNHHAVISGFYSNLGWNGLSSALLAGNHPGLVIATSIFYAYLDTGAGYATIVSDITIELSEIIKSVLFFVISSRLIKEQFIKRSIR